MKRFRMIITGYEDKCTACGSIVTRTDGASLREARKEAHISLRSMAREIGVSAAFLSDMERNRRRVTPAIQQNYERVIGRLQEAPRGE